MFCVCTYSIHSQKITNRFYNDSLSIYLTKDTSFINKKIPTAYSGAIKIALQYYPDLKYAHIIFKVKNKLSPLAASPTVFSAFRKASKRKYKVVISKKTITMFDSILLKNLSFNSQVGVIGHEISHIQFYNTQRGLYFIKLVLMHLSKKSIDAFENNTDTRCIEHGLGYQLLSWSKEVRLKLNIIKWKGIKNMSDSKRERYMNPETIENLIKQLNTYN